jgi:hypothetical protein
MGMVPIPKLSPGRSFRSGSIRRLGAGLAGPPIDPGALVGVARRLAAGGFGTVTATPETDGGLSGGLLLAAAGDLRRRPFRKTSQVRQATQGYAEKVRSQFLSLRHRPKQPAIKVVAALNISQQYETFQLGAVPENAEETTICDWRRRQTKSRG